MLIAWSEVLAIGAAGGFGIEYVAVCIEKETAARFRLIDRPGLKIQDRRHRHLELTEAQLGLTVETALGMIQATLHDSSPR